MIDATTLAVLQGKLGSVTDEMDVLLVRGAFSPIISEALDRASGVYHPETGEIIVQGETSLPIFAVTMQFAVLAVIERCLELGVEPGDVFILNDTQRTGTHLHDVKLVSPIFHDGRLICFLANVAHWLDIGGAVPAGYNPKATDMIQEGLVIPPAKVYEAGTLNRSLFDLIIANTRLPEQNTADFFTMAGCLDAGGRRIGELIERYGASEFSEALDELILRSEQQMRSHIREIPDGRYEASAHIDNDGLTDTPLTIRLAAIVEGDSMTLDFTGSSDACNGPFNIAAPTTMAACFIALKHVFPDVPLNAGCFKPLDFVLPEASLVNSPRGKSQEFYLEASLSPRGTSRRRCSTRWDRPCRTSLPADRSQRCRSLSSAAGTRTRRSTRRASSHCSAGGTGAARTRTGSSMGRSVWARQGCRRSRFWSSASRSGTTGTRYGRTRQGRASTREGMARRSTSSSRGLRERRR